MDLSWPRIRRWLGALLIVHGLVGLIIVVAGGAIGIQAAIRLEETLSTGEEAVGEAARTARSAAEALGSVGASLEEVADASERGADLARQGAETNRQLASAMRQQIFGAAPFASLGAGFEELAVNLDTFSEDLGAMSDAMRASNANIAPLAIDLRALGERLRAESLSGPAADDAAPLVFYLTGILLWIGLQSVVSLLGGVILVSVRPVHDPAQPHEREHEQH